MMLSIALDEKLDTRGLVLDRNNCGSGSEIHDIPCGLALSLFAYCTDMPYNTLTASPPEFQRKLQGLFWLRRVFMHRGCFR